MGKLECHDTQPTDIQHNDSQHNDTQHNDTPHNVVYCRAECHFLCVIMLSVIIMSVVAPDTLQTLI